MFDDDPIVSTGNDLMDPRHSRYDYVIIKFHVLLYFGVQYYQLFSDSCRF